MKILSKEQLYQADQITQKRQGISSTQLMERAAVAAFTWLHNRLQGAPVPVKLFCGIGNNGGDGLAMARHLVEHGYHVQVYIVNYSDKRSPDFLINLDALKERKVWPETLKDGTPLPVIDQGDIVVDALFGIGLNRTPAPWVQQLMQHMNASGAGILSLDIPSGLFMDRSPEAAGAVVRAQYVLTFGAPKLPLFLPETGVYAGYWEVLDIGLDPGHLAEVDAAFSLVGRMEARTWYRPRQRFTHKGTYGHALVIGGSYGKTGAVALAARACLRTGAGLVTAWVPKCAHAPLQTGVPEAMVATPEGMEYLDAFPKVPEGYVAVAGMGMGQDPVTSAAFLEWLKDCKAPLVLDADALNVLAAHPDALGALHPGSILTPHPGELRRLIGSWEDDFDKVEKAMAFASRTQCVLLVKGAYTLIFWGGKGYVNTSGNPGMATAGSGDVLAGMLAGLLAQGYAPPEAALLGVYLHGLAGDIAASETGMEAMMASDLANSVGKAYQHMLTDPPATAATENETEEAPPD